MYLAGLSPVPTHLRLRPVLGGVEFGIVDVGDLAGLGGRDLDVGEVRPASLAALRCMDNHLVGVLDLGQVPALVSGLLAGLT